MHVIHIRTATSSRDLYIANKSHVRMSCVLILLLQNLPILLLIKFKPHSICYSFVQLTFFSFVFKASFFFFFWFSNSLETVSRTGILGKKNYNCLKTVNLCWQLFPILSPHFFALFCHFLSLIIKFPPRSRSSEIIKCGQLRVSNKSKE